jgi:sugar lactone lactonase YvrE
MGNLKAELVLDARAELGECPIWSVEEQRLWWIDIDGKALHRFDPASGKGDRWPLPEMPGSFVLREGGGLTLAMRDGIHDFDAATGKLARRLDPPFDPALFRFNDGRTDRQGRFWVGSMFAELGHPEPLTGETYCYDGTSLISRIAPIDHANGNAFSPDGRTMYRSETSHRTIHAYDLDPERGTVSNERLFARVPDELGLPDGATIDSEGGYWSALPAGPNGGSVARFTPDGKLDMIVDVPVLVPTMPAFGGADMATLYITTGRLEDFVGTENVQPTSGGLYAVETGFRGIPEVKFRPR